MKKHLQVSIFLLTLIALTLPFNVFAKGSFSFVVIRGGGMDGELRSVDPALTDTFFAFADFSSAKTDKPASLGIGYEVIRYYSDTNGHEQAFDHLHYYPDSRYVFYDGIVNGWSEYDGKWYVASPDIKVSFENALIKQTQSATPLIIVAALSLLFVVAFLVRQTSTY